MAGNLIKKDGILEKGNLRIPFQIIRSSRKTLAVQVKADGQVVIRVPLRTSWKEAERFLERESAWVERHVAAALASYVEPRTYTDAQVREGKARARELFARRTAHFSAVMGVDYGRISVRQQNPLGQLQRAGKSEFQLEAGADAGGDSGLCGGPRAGAPCGDEPLAPVLGGGGDGAAGLAGAKTVA